METAEHTLLKDLLMGNAINKEWARNNFAELSRFVDYYEIPLHLWQCLQKDDSLSYSRVLAENQQVIARFDRETERIAAVLKHHDIDYCILVGIPFARRFFLSPDLRLQEDIDFFIRAADYKKVLGLIKELGYVTLGKAPSKNQKHQSFINEGFQKESSSAAGRNIVKFYLSLSLEKYFPTRFENFADAIILYEDRQVLNDTATLIHLILHAHLYDVHPKILADIYMVCQRGTIDWPGFWFSMQQLKATFLAAIVLQMMKVAFWVEHIYLPGQLVTPAVLTYAQQFSSKKWWNKMHPVLTPEQLTGIRAHLTGNPDYQEIFARDVKNDLCRRVGVRTREFIF